MLDLEVWFEGVLIVLLVWIEWLWWVFLLVGLDLDYWVVNVCGLNVVDLYGLDFFFMIVFMGGFDLF